MFCPLRQKKHKTQFNLPTISRQMSLNSTIALQNAIFRYFMMTTTGLAYPYLFFLELQQNIRLFLFLKCLVIQTHVKVKTSII